MKLNEIFAQYGRTDLYSLGVADNGRNSMRSYQNIWAAWYKGYVPSFHRYKRYNGQKMIWLKHRSMDMAKTVCEDWASLLLNEKTEVKLGDAAAQKVIDDIFAANNFWQEANQGLEKAFALGIGAFVIRVDKLDFDADGVIVDNSAAKLKIEFVNGQKIYPFTIDDKTITECAFATKRGDTINISLHLLNEAGNYVIYNIRGKVDKQGSISYDADQDVYAFDTGSNIPWFQILKPNLSNNIDIDSPLGISVFANATDALETVDLIFDAFGGEYDLGRKRVYVSAEAITVTENGETRITFDPNDIAYYVLPYGNGVIGSDGGKPYVQESTGELRADALVTGINQALNILSTKVGLGENRYRFDKGGITTATQVISENSSMFRNVRRHEILIEQVLIDLVRTILYAINAFTPQSVNENVDITVNFDDSIIEDKAAERTRDLSEVAQGLMEKWEFRVKWYGEDEATAKAWQEAKAASVPRLSDIYNGEE